MISYPEPSTASTSRNAVCHNNLYNVRTKLSVEWLHSEMFIPTGGQQMNLAGDNDTCLFHSKKPPPHLPCSLSERKTTARIIPIPTSHALSACKGTLQNLLQTELPSLALHSELSLFRCCVHSPTANTCQSLIPVLSFRKGCHPQALQLMLLNYDFQLVFF